MYIEQWNTSCCTGCSHLALFSLGRAAEWQLTGKTNGNSTSCVCVAWIRQTMEHYTEFTGCHQPPQLHQTPHIHCQCTHKHQIQTHRLLAFQSLGKRRPQQSMDTLQGSHKQEVGRWSLSRYTAMPCASAALQTNNLLKVCRHHSQVTFAV